MTCCFQGRCHGNTEEDGELDSASQKKERKKEATELKRAADMMLLLITAKGKQPRGGRGDFWVIPRVQCASQF